MSPRLFSSTCPLVPAPTRLFPREFIRHLWSTGLYGHTPFDPVGQVRIGMSYKPVDRLLRRRLIDHFEQFAEFSLRQVFSKLQELFLVPGDVFLESDLHPVACAEQVARLPAVFETGSFG